MDRQTTLFLLGTGLVLTVAGLIGARRKRPLGTVSFVPWNGLMFLGIVAACVAAAHLPKVA
jgi:hypothetical protein